MGIPPNHISPPIPSISPNPPRSERAPAKQAHLYSFRETEHSQRNPPQKRVSPLFWWGGFFLAREGVFPSSREQNQNPGYISWVGREWRGDVYMVLVLLIKSVILRISPLSTWLMSLGFFSKKGGRERANWIWEGFFGGGGRFLRNKSVFFFFSPKPPFLCAPLKIKKGRGFFKSICVCCNI